MAIEELKSCPFCGGEDIELTETQLVHAITGEFKKAIYCNDCLCEGPAHIDQGRVIAQWNERAHPEQPASAPVDERAAFEKQFTPESSAATFWMRRTRNGDYSNAAMQSSWQGWQARALLSTQPPELNSKPPELPKEAPANPLDMVLPCDIELGNGIVGKGCKLSTLVLRMKSLHTYAASYAPKFDISAFWRGDAELQPAPAVVDGELPVVAWLIDWPEEPELGHYFAEGKPSTGRSRELVTLESAIAYGQACARKAGDEIKALHVKLASETLRADQGWQRYEAANVARNRAEEELARKAGAGVVAEPVAIRKKVTAEEVKNAAINRGIYLTSPQADWVAESMSKYTAPPAAPAGSDDKLDAERWRAMRTGIAKLEFLKAMNDSLPEECNPGGRYPTPEEMDASVDAGIAAISAGKGVV